MPYDQWLLRPTPNHCNYDSLPTIKPINYIHWDSFLVNECNYNAIKLYFKKQQHFGEKPIIRKMSFSISQEF